METLSNFQFRFAGHGHWRVVYTSPKTGKTWAKTIDNMLLIDATKNSDNPRQSDLIELKRKIKS